MKIFQILEKLKCENGCWIGDFALTQGYATCWLSGIGQIRIHRFMYEFLIEKIPDGLHIDHLCRNRPCVNPMHLEPVTPKENIYRGLNGNSIKTHCPQGHKYDGENLIWKTGISKRTISRQCKTCHRIQNRERYRRTHPETNWPKPAV